MKWTIFLIGVALLLAACSSASTPEASPCPTAAPCPACPTASETQPEAQACPEPVVKTVPYQEAWLASAHADAEAAAFTHWNEEDPAEIPVTCAKCHSTPGFQDFVGADGSDAGTVDKPAPIGTVITCEACHNPQADALSSVVFPSGAEVTGLGGEARCMQCHQGLASKVQVDQTINELGVAEDLDTVNSDLGFINVHYFPAGATLYGTQVLGGYQYDGKMYDGKFRHTAGIDTCLGCHDQHTLTVKVEVCAECHSGVSKVEDLQTVRMQGSLADYDGDGNTTEGIAAELEGLQAMLLQAIQAYGTEVAGASIGYKPDAYPYFFIDTNGDGQISEDEAAADNAYKSWTGRLLKAAYNYQMAAKDPGKFAHNAKYMIQLMYDSTEDLNTVLATPVDLTTAHRQDPGHFAGNTEPFRYWDEAGEVPAACVKCHTAEGLPMFIHNNATIAVEPSNGFMCSTCHDEANWPNRYVVDAVTFPSGAKLTFGEGKDANLCLMCHQGQSSTPTVNKALAGKPAGIVDETLSFANSHYFAAGATLFGSEAQGAYQYEGKQYVGKHLHVESGFDCETCHDVHALEVKTENCTGCHAAASDPKDPKTYRMDYKDPQDWDGDGDVTEGVSGELSTVAEKLYAAIQAYARSKGTPIVYDADTYPYFLVDANEDGVPDTGENGPLAYNAWTPDLLKAAYNYQYYQKDPGAFAHNVKYVLQVMYDSIESLGGDTQGLIRP